MTERSFTPSRIARRTENDLKENYNSNHCNKKGAADLSGKEDIEMKVIELAHKILDSMLSSTAEDGNVVLLFGFHDRLNGRLTACYTHLSRAVQPIHQLWALTVVSQQSYES